MSKFDIPSDHFTAARVKGAENFWKKFFFSIRVPRPPKPHGSWRGLAPYTPCRGLSPQAFSDWNPLANCLSGITVEHFWFGFVKISNIFFHFEISKFDIKFVYDTKKALTPEWLEHPTFWSGVRRATIAP